VPNAEELRLAGTTVAVLEERVKNHVQFFWTVIAFLVAWLGVGTYFIVDMRGDIKVLLRPQNLTKAASNPTDPKSQANAQKIIAEAKKDAIPLPQGVVEQTWKEFTSATPTDPKAWGVAVELVSYRTTLNGNVAEVGTADEIARTRVNPNLISNYAIRFLPGYGPETASVGGDVPIDQAATIQAIGLPSLEQGRPRGKEIILIENSGIVLDGEYMRHVVIRNTTVQYDGGPLQLEDVTFVNCTFKLIDNQTTRAFASAVLVSAPTMFPPTHI
jgi:hypothetical protein